MKARSKKRKFRFLIFPFFLILFSIATYYILSLPIWKIQEVKVTGTNMLSAEEIRDLSGIPLSENLFLTSFSRTRNNLRKISAILDFKIYRIPPATVLIKIAERKPIAVIIFKGRSVIVDEDGAILNRNPNLTLNVPNLEELPVISGIGTGEVVGEEKVDPKLSHLISGVIIELSSLLGSRRIQLELGGFEKISFLLDDMLRVKVGRDENIKRKMEVFKALMPVIANRWDQVEYVDVRYPDNPVIKYK